MCRARTLLEDAIEHSKILQEIAEICHIKVCLARIEYVEGNYQKSLEFYQDAFKLNREVK